MVLSNTDLEKIRNIIVTTFNEQFMQEIVDKVGKIVNEKYEKQISDIEKSLNNFNSEIIDLKRKNSILEKQIDNQEQSSRNLNIRIFGVPYKEGENLHNITLGIFKDKMKLNINEADLKKCHRVYAKNHTDKPPAVLVSFCGNSARSSVLKNRKSLKTTGIQIKEDLTQTRLVLMAKAIEKFDIKNVWCLNGNIYVKYNGAVSRINGLDDIEVILRK